MVLKLILAGPMSPLLLRAPASCWRAPWSVSRSLESVEYREGCRDGPGPTWISGARETQRRDGQAGLRSEAAWRLVVVLTDYKGAIFENGHHGRETRRVLELPSLKAAGADEILAPRPVGRRGRPAAGPVRTQPDETWTENSDSLPTAVPVQQPHRPDAPLRRRPVLLPGGPYRCLHHRYHRCRERTARVLAG